jgi:beta-galactosidase/beta-glucuronidase
MRSDSFFMNFLKITVIFLCLMCAASFSRADTESWRLIAQEDAGSNSYPSFFGLTPRWHYSDLVISAEKIPVDAQERTVVYGSDVPILFQNLNAAYPVKLEMTFLSDCADRAVRILAGNSVLQNQLPIPFASVLRKNWIIPTDSIKNGRLDIHVESLAGPNAVVCGFRLYSADPQAQKIHPISFHIAPLFVPHLIEQPSYVQGISALRLNLNGMWRFHPDASSRGNWKTIQVPGEWAMQGFTVSPDHEAEYQRSFYAPTQWKNCRVILKCAGVYSAARVYVNSHKVGMHIGGFTQFEFDITSCLRFGQTNSISIYIRSASLADRLASGMQYAAHDLGGITRDIHLMAAPKAYLEDEHIVTHFDRNFRNALLEVGATVIVKSSVIGHKLRIRYILRDVPGKEVRLNRGTLSLPQVSLGNGVRIRHRFSVHDPLKWDSEHPHLYTLEVQIISGSQIIEKVPCRFGFRQIDVRGGRIFVNNHPIKLRGVCRHETDPLRGRSLLPGMWTRDAALFRAANVNVIRTSHYPPPEELVQACDELGMFVEEEAPFCWANPADSEDAAYVSQAEMEMALRDRNHPSVLQWSLGNESPWSMAFVAGYHALRTLDNTRPILFDGGGEPSPPLDIDAPHYPGLAGPSSYAHSPRPVFIGEESHLECYNRKEILTDPGLRDIWEMGFSQMWENMYHSDGCEGGDIWAGIDDNFFMPSGKIVG